MIVAAVGRLLRRRTLEVVLALALGYALVSLVVVISAEVVSIWAQHADQHEDDLFGTRPLSFRIGDTVIFYGPTVAAVLSLAVVALLAAMAIRARARTVEHCPHCLSEVHVDAMVCPNCILELTPEVPPA